MAYKKLKYWFDEELAKLLSSKILIVYPEFNSKAFVADIVEGINELELKDRVSFIAEKLMEHLPEGYDKAINLLIGILGPENENETGMFTEGYWVMPIAAFVEKYGLDHFETSMEAIREITKRNTGEYCIRPFIEEHTEKTLKEIEKWSHDENVHIRRLASEGLRPRLPWASKLDLFIKDPQPVLAILENLKDDSSKFVQKSVANNLNDILKDNYEMGMQIIRTWTKGVTKQRKWVIKHALRNLIKKEDPQALEILALVSKE